MAWRAAPQGLSPLLGECQLALPRWVGGARALCPEREQWPCLESVPDLDSVVTLDNPNQHNYGSPLMEVVYHGRALCSGLTVFLFYCP